MVQEDTGICVNITEEFDIASQLVDFKLVIGIHMRGVVISDYSGCCENDILPMLRIEDYQRDLRAL